MLRDIGESPMAGTSQRDLARVRNGRASREVWVRRMSDGDRQRREVLDWEGSGMGLTTGVLFSSSRLGGLQRRWIEGKVA